jgi:hypothetical protein
MARRMDEKVTGGISGFAGLLEYLDKPYCN